MQRLVHDTLTKVAAEYPPGELRNSQMADIDRIAFHVTLVLSCGSHAVCDIGGGIGMFSVGCAALGMNATLVDDFRDPVNLRFGNDILKLHRAHGVRVISRDVVMEGVGDFARESFDAVTIFDSMEHWHHSPRSLFRQLLNCLKPGGLFLLGGPNCVNLRKRITVPFGFGKWSSMSDWYESDVFRGHVREPDVDDLRYIAQDLGLKDVKIVGRNWLGFRNSRAWIRAIAPIVDRALILAPSLCSDIYLTAHKP